jgi:enoyl-CoA hydratase/carnithine racemase
MATISTRYADGVLTIVLDRPTEANQLTLESFRELDAAMDDAAVRADVAAVVVTGAGSVFCGGLDPSVLEVLRAMAPPAIRATLRKWNITFGTLEAIEKPVVAALNGPALGGGCEIALACDVRLAARGAHLRLAETRLGVIPDGGGCTRLARLVGIGRAKEMIMSGDPVSATDAERFGLVNRVVDATDLPGEAAAFARRLTQGGPLGIGVAKRVIVQAFSLDVSAGTTLEALAGSSLYANEYFSRAYSDFLSLKRRLAADSAPDPEGR